MRPLLRTLGSFWFIAWTLFSSLVFGQESAGSYFIAIDIPASLEGKLLPYQEPLSKKLYGRWEEKEKFHITLQYLGELSPQELAQIQKTFRETLALQKDFEITIANLGFFPTLNKARVAWLGVQSQDLQDLQSRLAAKMAKRPETFVAHITMGRLTYAPPPGVLEKLQVEVEKLGPLSFSAQKILLFQSFSGKYEEVDSVVLQPSK